MVFILPVNAETKIIAKKGDTLFKLSKEYNVQLKTLMHKNNFNDATMLLEGEVIILPRRSNQINNISYTVVEGDTLYKIARDYNIKLKDLITINNLGNNSFLELGQIIILPKGSIRKEVISNKSNILASKKLEALISNEIELKTKTENSDDKELFVDQNWKINSKNLNNIISSDNSNLKRILSDIFPNKKIVIQDNNDGSQTIFLS